MNNYCSIFPTILNAHHHVRRSLAFILFATAACASAPSAATPGVEATRGGMTVAPIPAGTRVSPGTNVSLTVPITTASDTVLLPADVAWQRLPAAYAAFGLTIDAADAATQSLGTGRLRLRRYLHGEPLATYLDCGKTAYGANVDTHDVEMRVRTTVESAGTDAAAIRTLVIAVAGQSGAGQSTARCSSTRALERRLAALVQVGSK